MTEPFSAGEPAAIPGYVIGDVIGRGGMGTVYRATAQSDGRPVAIKLLAAGFLNDPAFIARFRREADLQAGLTHPHIVPVLASGEHLGVPYIVMRLVEGPSLRDLIRAHLLEPAQAVVILDGIAAALDHAHAHGVLHRDVKPHNVLVEGGTHGWLADFGLTRLLEDATGLTATGGMVGTFDYLAPEIAQGAPASAASDIYSLAVTTFQAITGRQPFPASNHAGAVIAHVTAERPRASSVHPGLPPAVDEPLQRGMAIDPLGRPATATRLLDDVGRTLGTPLAPGTTGALATEAIDAQASSAGTVAGTAPSPASPRAPDHRRRAIGAALTALGVTAVIVIAVLLATNGSGPSRRPHPPVVDARAAAAAHRTFAEITGGSSHTWSDAQDAGGIAGPQIRSHETVEIRCRLAGWKVPDGNVWWYRIASRPWDGRFYVTGDAFYNGDKPRGSLARTPFYDPRIPICQEKT